MSINLTKLADAEYYLQQIEDILGDGPTGANPAEYYTREGNPPGTWIGSGSELLGYETGRTADSEQVRDVINKSRDPASKRLLGDPKDVLAKTGRDKTGGWDLTFTNPKSLSVMWALGDETTRDGIDECIEKAKAMTIARFEHEALATRAGAGGVANAACDGIVGFDFRHYSNRDGDPHPHDHIVFSNRVRRTSDKQWTAIDGRLLYGGTVEYSELYNSILMDVVTERFGWNWVEKPNTRGTRAVVHEIDGVDPRLLDIFSSRRAEIKNKVDDLIKQEEDRVGHPLDWRRKKEIDNEVWEETRKAKPETPESLETQLDEWRDEAERLVPDLDLERMFEDVGRRHGEILHVDDPTGRRIGDLLFARMLDVTGSTEQEIGDTITKSLEGKRTTWTRSNIRAEATRIVSGIRVDPTQRAELVERIADAAASRMVKLTPTRYKLPQTAENDPDLASLDGRSVFDDPRLDRYTSTGILSAEDRIDRYIDQQAPCAFRRGEGRSWLDGYRARGGRLADDQYEAAVYALENPKAVSTIIGPAGTGKTTTMRAVADAWRSSHGDNSVLGVCLSNRAKDELHGSIGCRSVTASAILQYYDSLPETEASYRYWQSIKDSPASLLSKGRRERADRELTNILARKSTYEVKAGDAIIVDEAGMVGTYALDRLFAIAAGAGARVILTGDPMQLDNPDGAGGTLASIDRKGEGYSRQLSSIWRFAGSTYDKDPDAFQAKWAGDAPTVAAKRQWVDEGAATLRLREGGRREDPTSVERCTRLAEEYAEHDRLHWGEDDDLEEQAYNTVLAWTKLGKSALLIAGDNDQVDALNHRFLLARQINGLSDPDPKHRIVLADHNDAGIGDQIICRANNPSIRSDDRTRGMQNGLVLKLAGFNAKTARLVDTTDGKTWHVPYTYLRDHCQGGYAITVHRAQGATVDRCYTYMRSGSDIPCNLQYVAGTRGREENHFGYACPDQSERKDDRLKTGRTIDPERYAKTRFVGAMLNHPDNRTAHETAADETQDRHNMKRLVAEHNRLGGLIAQRHLLKTVERFHGTKTADRVRRSPNLEWLTAAWSRAFMTAPRRAMAIISRPLKTGNKQGKRKTAPDPASILAARVNNGLLDRENGVVHDEWAARIVPPIRSSIHDERWDMIQQNERLLERRSRELERQTKKERPAWLETIAPAAARDRNLIRDIAVYRDQWSVTDEETPLGERPPASSGLQEQHWVQIADRIGGNGPGVVNPSRRQLEQARETAEQADDIPPVEQEPVDYLDLIDPDTDMIGNPGPVDTTTTQKPTEGPTA